MPPALKPVRLCPYEPHLPTRVPHTPACDQGLPPDLEPLADALSWGQDLDFTQLAAVMGALVTPEVVSRPGIYATIQASAAAQDAVLALEPLQATLEDMQLDAGLVLPLTVDLRLAGALLRLCGTACGLWSRHSMVQSGSDQQQLCRSQLLCWPVWYGAWPGKLQAAKRQVGSAFNRQILGPAAWARACTTAQAIRWTYRGVCRAAACLAGSAAASHSKASEYLSDRKPDYLVCRRGGVLVRRC